MEPERRMFVSLAFAQQVSPDNHFESTVDNLRAMWGAGEDDAIWTLQAVPVGLIHPFQLIDDPDDDEANAKVEGLRETMQSGGYIPPVYVIHVPQALYQYTLIEGRHRYNAAHRERAEIIAA